LALHGWLDNAAAFDSLASLLPNLHFIALDFPGHGFSEHRPPGVNYHFVDYVKDVIAAADALGREKFILLGHSLGAAVASIVAGAFPDRISKLILIEGLGPVIREEEKAHEHLSVSIRQMTLLPRQKQARYSDLDDLTSLRSEVGGLNKESAALLVKRNLKKEGKNWIWRSDPRLKFISPSYLTNEQVNSFLRQIQAPTLLITGKSGRLVNNDKLEYFKERRSMVKNISHISLEGGHHLQMENPEPVSQAVRDFIFS